MSLETRMKQAYKNLKAPEGKYIVCAWDPSNPEKSIPVQVAGPYTKLGFAKGYAKRMDAKPQPLIGERAYVVIDDKGLQA